MQSLENKEKRMNKYEERLCDLQDTMKGTICELLEFQKEKRRRGGRKHI